ncbi:MAG: DUF2512 family protein [Firmicutes bacterium]|nr:DUF2512 family protein [Bacillota bacterium]
MKNLTNLILKAAMIWLLLGLLIPVFGSGTWSQTLITGLTLVLLSYVAIDLWVLPKYGNIAALIAEFGLLALVIWGMTEALPQFRLTDSGYWIIALALTAGEWFFHQYLLATKAPHK